MAVETLENLEAILSGTLPVQELRLVECTILDRLLSARVNFQYQEAALKIIHETLAAKGEKPLIYEKPD